MNSELRGQRKLEERRGVAVVGRRWDLGQKPLGIGAVGRGSLGGRRAGVAGGDINVRVVEVCPSRRSPRGR